MSIPIDLVYDYIAGYVNYDVIIYRWTPPGSKNIGDLQPLQHYQRHWRDTRPVMICHDQEPLDWSLYNSQHTLQWIQDDFCRYWQVEKTSEAWPWTTDRVLQSWVQPNEITNVNQKMLLLHSEFRSSAVELSRSMGWCPVHIWSHGIIAQDWFRYARYDQSLHVSTTQRADFLIYSRAWSGSREYRLWFLDQLVQQDLVSVCTVRFNPCDQGSMYHQHQFSDVQWQCSPRWSADIFYHNSVPAWASATYDAADYCQHFIEIVLETVVDRTHLTEKVCRPIACGKPFMLAAGQGALQYLRDYGFRTFAPWINESYDLESDNKKRLQMIIDEMHKIIRMSPRDRLNLIANINQVARYNQRHFFNDAFLDNIMQDFGQQYMAACLELGHQSPGDATWQKYLYENYPDVTKLLGKA